MASFVHIADVHLGFEQYQLAQRFNDFGRAFRSVIDNAIARKVDFILISGDLFNKRAINAPTLIQAKMVLDRARAAEVPVIVVEGNHDMSYYRDRESWLSFLRHDGLIILLEPTMNSDGSVVFEPWNERRKRGGYIEIGDARIFGLGWWGASTVAVAKQAAETIRTMSRPQSDPVKAIPVNGTIESYQDRGDLDTSLRSATDQDTLPEKKFTILMLHAGIEGYVPKMSGCIDAGALAPLRDCVDYLALGHIHKGYDQDNWLFNPGSLETWSISELNWRHGMYHVVFSGDGIKHVEHIDGATWRRPFQRWTVDLGAASDPADALRIVEEHIGNSSPGIRTESSTDTDSSSREPIIHLDLTGVVRFDRNLIDTDAILDRIMRNAAPLHIIIRNDTRSPDFDFEVDRSGAIPREILERDVVRSLIGNDERFAAAADPLSSLIIDIKDHPGRPPERTLEAIRRWSTEQSTIVTDGTDPTIDRDKDMALTADTDTAFTKDNEEQDLQIQTVSAVSANETVAEVN